MQALYYDMFYAYSLVFIDQLLRLYVINCHVRLVKL